MFHREGRVETMSAPPPLHDRPRREPRLAGLLAEEKAYHRQTGPDFCANAVWYGYHRNESGLKFRLARLVGYARSEKHPVLSRRDAYDMACNAVLDALP